MMRVPLAWNNLRHQPTRTAVAVFGVGFALLLIFMQLGFFGAVQRTATLLYNVLDFDVMLVSSQYVELNQSHHITAERLRQAASDPDVTDAKPMSVTFLPWRIQAPDRPEIDGRLRTLLAIAVNPDDPPLRLENFERPDETAEALPKLSAPGVVLMDTRTRDEFGEQTVGTRSEMANVPVVIEGHVTLGAGFGADGLVFAHPNTVRRATGIDPRERPNFGLLKVAPGADPEEVAERLNERLPPDVRAVSREVLFAAEQRHWIRNTSVGIIFAIGVGVAVIVGVVFVYQVMAGDITNHLAEYATLKAVGYTNGYLRLVVVQQALMLSLLGYVPGFIGALGLYALARPNGIPAAMDVWTGVTVLIIGVGMCAASGLLAVRKAQKADPAELF